MPFESCSLVSLFDLFLGSVLANLQDLVVILALRFLELKLGLLYFLINLMKG